MKKLDKHHALFLLPLLPLLVAACHRQEQPEALSGPVGFAVQEEIPDFQTKAAEIYRSSDSPPLTGDDIAVWAYNLPAQSSPVSVLPRVTPILSASALALPPSSLEQTSEGPME